MASDTGSDTSPNLATAYKATALAAAGVGVVAFAVSFHGLLDLLQHVAQLPLALAAIGPLGVDFFALVGIAASFVMRHEKWTRRAYAALIVVIALAMSVAGNWVDGVSRRLPGAGVTALALSPVIVFLASHLVVVCRRSVEDQRRTAVAGTPEAPDPDEDEDLDDDRDERPRRPFDPRRYARQRCRAGDSTKTIAQRLADRGHDVHPRTVARWTEDIRPGRRAAGTDETTDTDPVTEGAST